MAFFWRKGAPKFGLTSGEYKVFESFFDASYYLATQPDVAKSGANAADHYLEFGWREGRNPSAAFDTIWYLHANPDAENVNPLVHYVRIGVEENRRTTPDQATDEGWRNAAEFNESLPAGIREYLSNYNKIDSSGLFDREFYQQTYGVLQCDPLEYYLRHGALKGHAPGPKFDPDWYRAEYTDVGKIDMNPFLHYLTYGRSEGRRRSAAQPVERQEPSPPVVASKPILDSFDGAINHELAVIAKDFDENFYRECNPDLDFATLNPLEHFCRFGWRDGRDPSPYFSVKGYWHYNPDVKQAGKNPFYHYLVNGKSEGRTWRREQRAPRPANGRSEWAGYHDVRALGTCSLENAERDITALAFCCVFAGLDLSEVAAKINFREPNPENIRVSIVIPCVNEELVTIECIASIEAAAPKDFDIEVIVVDNGSTDPSFKVLGKNPTLQYLRFDKNIGFGPACNAGAKIARGVFVFFLNNDAQIAPGCLETMVEAMEQDWAGLVGPKILSFDGTLQEAGCLLNGDGSGTLIGFGCDHRAPRYNYTRDVEHVSGAAILLRRKLFAELGGFDDVFSPAYCEDADLSLKIRQKGLRVIYEPKAVVAHHLSKTARNDKNVNQSKLQRIARNRQVLMSRWADTLAAKQLRTIAFYLPQYHPIPENDLWWGKGFTEWTNVTRAKPNYVGHDQPRTPADLGYYDLRVPEVMEQQAAMARRYGISGFCYYYYWFDGKRLLEHPIERMLATGKPDLPFCLCWANENWTRRWDGKDNDILLGQSYTDEGALEIIKDLARYMRSDTYIRIHGRPLVLVYRIKELPNPARMTAMWRNYCRQNDLGEICIAMVESFELSASPEDPVKYGCDITVEFPAHGMVHDEPKSVEKLNFDWTGKVHDYRELAGAFMRRVEIGRKRIRSVLVGWDNTPRHPDKSLILENATPGAFQAWLEWTYRRTLEQNFGDERIVFILAWNEWCEGSYLEPDRQFGHGYLQAVRNALDVVESGRDAFVL